MNAGLAFLAAGIAVLGAALAAGLGIGRLASAALEGTARQPEASGDIRTTMIIAAALIEGVAIIGEVVALVMIFTAPA
ncbi:MAG: ATP synthase F0 subunit C [Bacteroidota bacterium]